MLYGSGNGNAKHENDDSFLTKLPSSSSAGTGCDSLKDHSENESKKGPQNGSENGPRKDPNTYLKSAAPSSTAAAVVALTLRDGAPSWGAGQELWLASTTTTTSAATGNSQRERGSARYDFQVLWSSTCRETTTTPIMPTGESTAEEEGVAAKASCGNKPDGIYRGDDMI